jgi:hypothetical protein
MLRSFAKLRQASQQSRNNPTKTKEKIMMRVKNAPRELSRTVRHFDVPSNGGVAIIRVKLPSGHSPNELFGAYHREAKYPGAYMQWVRKVCHAKRREYLVYVRFGYDA